MRERELRNRGKFKRQFDTGDLVIVSKQVFSSRKDRIPQKKIQNKGNIQSHREGYTKLILDLAFSFL